MKNWDKNKQKVDSAHFLNENDCQYQMPFIQKETTMILSDFLTLESYFGNQETAQFFEDCVQKYGVERLQKRINAGELAYRQIHIGPDAGKCLLWLTQKGREQASQMSS